MANVAPMRRTSLPDESPFNGLKNVRVPCYRITLRGLDALCSLRFMQGALKSPGAS
jgi:hypothetical protein